MAQRDEASVAASADLGVSGIPAELAEARATIDPDFAEKFLGFMVREVIRHHEDIKAEYDEGSRL